MTSNTAFVDMAAIVADLSRSLPQQMRYQRLLEAFDRNFPCDAIALLELKGDTLVPRATKGLSPGVMGRRFAVANHPRLARLLASRKSLRFAADSELPDPYDGLIEHADGHLNIHDCMGAALLVDEVPWGVVTLDTLDPNAFDNLDMEVFEAFLGVASATVRAASLIDQLEQKLERRKTIELSQASPSGFEMIAESPEMVRLLAEIKTVASSDLTVLIQGETGVGKELVAKQIHHHSARASEPMVHVNCAALPLSLAESELFGHVKGAFTGAEDDRLGKFQLADEATLFLDEVGELPLELQSKLLRTLQNGEIQRVGSDQHQRVNVRVIAATNRDLKIEVAEGRFRADLYHRLSVYPLVVPPLRERVEDILPLAGYFLERNHRRLGLRGVRMTAAANRWMRSYAWPGNIRELEHTLSRAMIRAVTAGQDTKQVIGLDVAHLEQGAIVSEPQEQVELPPPAVLGKTLTEAVDDYKRDIIAESLREHSNNRAAVARALGLDRGNLVRQMQRLGLS